MKVSELGEFGLIDLLAKTAGYSPDRQVASQRQLLLGIGDDAAAWRVDTSIELATVDSLIQGVHFSLDLSTWADLGWKAMAANLSDIAAMGGLPRYALISLALPPQTEVADVISLYQGMAELSKQHGVTIAGGDTCSAPLVAITITIIGTPGRNELMLTRSAARPGDKAAVTGHLGAAAAGLEMLTRQLNFSPEATADLSQAFLRPYPRITEGRLLLEKGVRAAIDISDGLVSDLTHLCQASRVGARIEIDSVPVHPQVRHNFGEKSIEMALSGGEDYELLFTGTAEAIDGVKRESSCPVTVIGEIVAGHPGEITLVDSKGVPFKLDRGGWEHFLPR